MNHLTELRSDGSPPDFELICVNNQSVFDASSRTATLLLTEVNKNSDFCIAVSIPSMLGRDFFTFFNKSGYFVIRCIGIRR